jgi:hypothetical protein
MAENRWTKLAILVLITALGLLVLFAWGRSGAESLNGTQGCKRIIMDCAITADGRGLADGVCTIGYFKGASVARQRVFSSDWLYAVRACEDGPDMLRDVKIGLRSFRIE